MHKLAFSSERRDSSVGKAVGCESENWGVVVVSSPGVGSLSVSEVSEGRNLLILTKYLYSFLN
jgi:hypothetical protein